jgi:hypothetical protein
MNNEGVHGPAACRAIIAAYSLEGRGSKFKPLCFVYRLGVFSPEWQPELLRVISHRVNGMELTADITCHTSSGHVVDDFVDHYTQSPSWLPQCIRC